MRDIFENKIEEDLISRLPMTDAPSADILFKGKVHQLDISLLNLTDRKIYDYHKIYELASECLSEKKPLYLSIE